MSVLETPWLLSHLTGPHHFGPTAWHSASADKKHFLGKDPHTWIQELTYSMFSRSRGSARPLPTEIVFITTKASQSTGTGLCWLTAPCPVTVHTLEPGGHLICSPALKDSSIFSKCSNYREIKCLPIPESKQNLRKEKKSNMYTMIKLDLSLGVVQHTHINKCDTQH